MNSCHTKRTARLILAIFDEFYARLCEYPFRAKLAFETMDTHVSIEISHQRLGLYSRYISEHGPRIVAAFPALANNEAIWDTLDRLFVAQDAARIYSDISIRYGNSNFHVGLVYGSAYREPLPLCD